MAFSKIFDQLKHEMCGSEFQVICHEQIFKKDLAGHFLKTKIFLTGVFYHHLNILQLVRYFITEFDVHELQVSFSIAHLYSYFTCYLSGNKINYWFLTNKD